MITVVTMLSACSNEKKDPKYDALSLQTYYETILNQVIDIVELNMLSITKDKDTSKLFLFLKPYSGPITDSNSYIITGVYQGKFKISKSGELIYDADKYGGVNLYQKEFAPLKLEEAKDRITEIVEKSRTSPINWWRSSTSTVLD